ncbi:unnamed protein product [Protopolystoma xenopodis]|uniref:Uncharacterized protein n=1 Tax=Protopolystoma xenopodis TaxID=117903 RepID=A0A448WC70_9PLAT|nr:unnamed protein product [Protopolystoma xenopodis]
MQILFHLSNRPDLEFRLNLFCCTRLNDYFDAQLCFHKPQVTDVVLNLSEGRFSPALIGLPARGPLFLLRNSRFLFRTPTRLVSVYDPRCGHFLIAPFCTSTCHTFDIASLEKACQIDLRRFSTTPNQEPDHFYDLLRLTGRLFRCTPNFLRDYFPSGRNLTFQFIRSDQYFVSTGQTKTGWVALSDEADSASRKEGEFLALLPSTC